jgi:hypothetical protein
MNEFYSLPVIKHLFRKLEFGALVNEFFACYRTRMFSALFTSGRQLSQF